MTHKDQLSGLAGNMREVASEAITGHQIFLNTWADAVDGWVEDMPDRNGEVWDKMPKTYGEEL